MSTTHLFLEYANLPLIGKPENFKNILDAIENEFGPVLPVSDLDLRAELRAPEGFREFTVIDYLQDCYSYIAKLGPDLNQALIKRGASRIRPNILYNLKSVGTYHENEYLHSLGGDAITSAHLGDDNTKGINIDRRFEIAFEAVYGFLDQQCTSPETERVFSRPCVSFNPWIQHVELKTLLNIPHIKCYECHQLAFIRILNKIITGQPYPEIPGLESLLHLGINNRRESLLINGPYQIEMTMGWKSPYDHNRQLRIGPDPEYPFKYIFSHLLMGLVSHSLAKFLINPKLTRSRLHKCEICGDFFVSHSSRKVCPPPKECERLRRNLNSSKSMAKNRDKTKATKEKAARLEAEKKQRRFKAAMIKPKC
jgi:hypothetical protein